VATLYTVNKKIIKIRFKSKKSDFLSEKSDFLSDKKI